MELNYARRMQNLRSSAIREILKLTQRPEVISMAGGLPAAELFPVEQIRQVTDEILREEGARALQYSTTDGHVELREVIAERMQQVHGADVSTDEVLVTCGSQQGLDLTGKLFLDRDDVVVCESPTYIGAINAFKAYEPRFAEVATDDDGMIPSSLEAVLEREPRARLVYVVPDFQNPSGRCWSLARRRALLDAAARHGLPVVEDSPYAELRFAGEKVPPVKALDDEGRVIFLGTFSKIYCPGLRLGWVAAQRDILRRYVLLKQGADLHTSSLAQLQLARYARRFGFEKNLAELRDLYRERRDVMLRTLSAELPPGVRWTRPEGGLFVWLELPAGVDAADLLTVCLEEDVAFVPGGTFFPNGGRDNTIRLNFSAMPPERIVEGVRRLGLAVRRHLEEADVDTETPMIAT